MKSGSLLRKITWKKKSRWELAIAAIGFSLGLGIFLVAAHVYLDLDTILNKRLKTGQKPDYLVISKQVGGSGNGFSAPEIESLAKNAFTLDIGKILANEFEVEAEVNIFSQGFRTMLFFEAVPARFLDVIPPGWDKQGTEDGLPIMVSRDFLLLYNFGFAQSHRFPLLTEDLLKIVPITLSIRGNGAGKKIHARIAGTSDRIASILIPYETMEALNRQFGSGKEKAPLRLVLSVKDRTDPEIVRYIEEHGYETSKEKLRLSDVGFTVRMIVSVVGIIGFILILLSFTVFLTTFRLIISRSGPEVALLIDLGYTKKSIASASMRMLLIAFAIITVVTGSLVWGCVAGERSFMLANGFSGFDFFIHPAIPVSGLAIIIISIILNYLSLLFSIGKKTR